MSAFKMLFRRVHTGGVLLTDPDGLSWQLDLDAANVTGVADGAVVNPWPDASGFGRNAIFNGANPLPTYEVDGTVPGFPAWPGGPQPGVRFQRGPAQSLRCGIPIIDATAGYTFFAWYYQAPPMQTGGGAIFNGGPGSRPMLLQNTNGFPGVNNRFGIRTTIAQDLRNPVYPSNHYGVCWRFDPTTDPAAERFCDVWVRPEGLSEEVLQSTAPHGLSPADTFCDIGFLFDGIVRRLLWANTALDSGIVKGVLNWGAVNYGVGAIL